MRKKYINLNKFSLKIMIILVKKKFNNKFNWLNKFKELGKNIKFTCLIKTWLFDNNLKSILPPDFWLNGCSKLTVLR